MQIDRTACYCNVRTMLMANEGRQIRRSRVERILPYRRDGYIMGMMGILPYCNGYDGYTVMGMMDVMVGR